MLIQVVRQMNSYRQMIDEQAEREAAAISTHQKEYRSAFCPIRANHVPSKDLATILGGAALSGVVSYIKF